MKRVLLIFGMALFLGWFLFTPAKKRSQESLNVPVSFAAGKSFSSKVSKLSLPPSENVSAEPVEKISPQIPVQSSKALKNYVLNRQNDPDQRRRALQVLIEKEAQDALPLVTAIAQTPWPNFPNAGNPHSVDAGLASFEKGLRITAIETIDQWGARGVPVKASFESIQRTIHDKELLFLTSVALSGLAEGRPGKVTRFIDKVFDEALEN